VKKLVGRRKVLNQDLGKEVLISTTKRNFKYQRGDFMILCQSKLLEVLRDKSYVGDTLRVLLFFMSCTEYGNRIEYYTQREIAEQIKVAQPKVSAAVKALEADKVIYKGKNGRDYYFNDELLLKGYEDYESK
jgi:DNA-binding MarR family transcriptional regulator